MPESPSSLPSLVDQLFPDLFADLTENINRYIADVERHTQIYDPECIRAILSKAFIMRANKELAACLILAQRGQSLLNMIPAATSIEAVYDQAQIHNISALSYRQIGEPNLAAQHAEKALSYMYRLVKADPERFEGQLPDYLQEVFTSSLDVDVVIANATRSRVVLTALINSDLTKYGPKLALSLGYLFAHRARLSEGVTLEIATELASIQRKLAATNPIQYNDIFANTLLQLSSGLKNGKLDDLARELALEWRLIRRRGRRKLWAHRINRLCAALRF